MKIDLRNIPVLYINMDKDVEKRNKMEKMLSENGFKNVIRVPAVQDSERYYRGLAESLHNILSSSQDLPFLVLEDDCELNTTNFIIDLPEDTDGVYIGVDAHPSIARREFSRYHLVEGDLYRVTNMVSTHAILYVSNKMREMFDRICRYCAFEDPDHIDQNFASVQRYFKIYAFNDPLFYQGGVGSSGLDTFGKTKIRLSDSTFP